MARFIIKGQQPLSGEIAVLGAKNAAIKMLAGSILFSGVTTLENVPDILDIQRIIDILEKMGASFSRKNHTLKIETQKLVFADPDPDLVGAIRASIVLVGPLLARFGRVKIPHPGGCIIGSRPIDLHLDAFQKLGVKITENNGFYEFVADENSVGSNTITFPKISVTATENILLYASLQEREITIQNAAIEPEVLDLCQFLTKAGVKISRENRLIKISGQKKLKSVTHRVIPDRIEAGTFAILAAATKNELKILNVVPEHLVALLERFEAFGLEFENGKDFLYIKKSREIKAGEIVTAPYPGFPTDLQPPFGLLLTQAKGISRLKENIFEHRLEYLHELQKMGARIKFLNSYEAEISGPTPLKGATIESLDLRAGATLLIAGLLASGTTEINHAENIDRGYEKIEERLKKIGAKIQRVL